MAITQRLGGNGTLGLYEVPDDELAVGSTLAGPRIVTIVKANGSIDKVFDIDSGATVLGTLILRHYDEETGAYLSPAGRGQFRIHPEHQEHLFRVGRQIRVHESIFALNGDVGPKGEIDVPAVYLSVSLSNESEQDITVTTFAFCVLRGDTTHDVEVAFDPQAKAFVAWNKSKKRQTRVIGCSAPVSQYETTLDFAKALSETIPADLSKETKAAYDPLGVTRIDSRIPGGDTVDFYFCIAVGHGRTDALRNYKAAPTAEEALARTKAHFHKTLGHSIVLTPDPHVNSGVLWAKANMLRVEAKTPIGWGFTNNPTKSNNGVARDTAWFGFGADLLTPTFARDSLLAYVHRQEKNGMIVEYCDLLTGRTEDYGLNINDNTPLIILALWHHYNMTGDVEFLRQTYEASVKAAKYILSQRNSQGLVWCTATGQSDWGIVGWRNVIPNYRLSGATTEVNSECSAALDTVSEMARVLGNHEASAFFAHESSALRKAINTHLYNPANGLYYLNIDLDGLPHSDVTSDLVFPVMFGVATEQTAAAIIARLAHEDFWTPGGMRTAPRDSATYTPDGGWGLLGGVWVGVSFWYAFAAARYSPQFMAHALSTTFRNYSSNPRQNNTVPGQFSEWLHGETLTNEGMMLSPWFPPRYLQAAVEGVAGLQISTGEVSVAPKLAPQWKWLAVRNVPFRGRLLTWLAARVPDLHIFANFHHSGESVSGASFRDDISDQVDVSSDSVCVIGLRHDQRMLLFAGNTEDRSLVTHVRVDGELLHGAYRVREYNSLLREWQERPELVAEQELKRGMTVQIERQGFWIFDLRQEV